jgi:hypothetical protein
MEKRTKRISPLAEVEIEALEAGQEWTRRRIEKSLQRLAAAQGGISPPEPTAVDPVPEDQAPGDDNCGTS